MEVTKVISRVKCLPKSFQNAFARDMEDFINQCIDEYDIFERGTTNRIDRKTLINRLRLQLNQDQPLCQAILKTGTPCTRRCRELSRYCKTHETKRFFDNCREQVPGQLQEPILVVENQSRASLEMQEDMDCVFIDDAFYYIDDRFVYDKDTLEKVGYVEGNGNEAQYVLTGDPFVLMDLNSIL